MTQPENRTVELLEEVILYLEAIEDDVNYVYKSRCKSLIADLRAEAKRLGDLERALKEPSEDGNKIHYEPPQPKECRQEKCMYCRKKYDPTIGHECTVCSARPQKDTLWDSLGEKPQEEGEL